MTSVSIVDYGLGNLLSVARAFDYFKVNVRYAHTPEDILSAERLILPGVGAFADGMEGLSSKGFIEPIKAFASLGKPFLGICLGMQLLLTESSEFGSNEGLNLIEGQVLPIPSHTAAGMPHKIPHIGWNELQVSEQGPRWENTILSDLPQNPAVYFVHSYRVVPKCPSKRLADTLYNGQIINAVVMHENIYGCQFHPEKSGEVGLKIIQQFMKI